MQEENSRASKAPLRLLERSVFCDRMVFVKAVHHLKHLSPVELEVYDSWFNPIVQMRPQLIPDGFVYLKTNADTCARRIDMRSRSEEATIPSDYLERLQGLHDDWLIDSGNSVVRDQSSTLLPPQSLMLGGMQTHTTNKLLPASMPPIYCLYWSHAVSVQDEAMQSECCAVNGAPSMSLSEWTHIGSRT